MILCRYLLRELMHALLALIVGLLIIMLSVTFVRYLSQVGNGSIPLLSAVAFLGIALPKFLSMLLPVSFFLSIVLVYGKLFANSELRVMFACGLSWWRLAFYTLLPGIALAVVSAILTLYLVPKMDYYQDNLSAIASAKTHSLSFAGTGQFMKFGSQIVYIGKMDHANGEGGNIFMYQALPKKHVRLVLAPTGEMINAAHGSQLVLNDGRVYQGVMGQKDFKIIQFRHYQVLLRHQFNNVSHGIHAASTMSLLRSPNRYQWTEFQWRLILPLSLILLSLLGVAMCYISPRRGRYAKLLNAFLLFILYFNALTILRSSMNQGIWPIQIGFGAIVVVFGGYAIFALLRLEGFLALRKSKLKVSAVR